MAKKVQFVPNFMLLAYYTLLTKPSNIASSLGQKKLQDTKASSLYWLKCPTKGGSYNSFKIYCCNALASGRIIGNTNLPETLTIRLFLTSKPG